MWACRRVVLWAICVIRALSFASVFSQRPRFWRLCLGSARRAWLALALAVVSFASISPSALGILVVALGGRCRTDG